MQKLTAINTQGSAGSRSSEEVDKQFLAVYNNEHGSKRVLPTLPVLSKDDIIVQKEYPSVFLISCLKRFLDSHEVKVDES